MPFQIRHLIAYLSTISSVTCTHTRTLFFFRLFQLFFIYFSWNLDVRFHTPVGSMFIVSLFMCVCMCVCIMFYCMLCLLFSYSLFLFVNGLCFIKITSVSFFLHTYTIIVFFIYHTYTLHSP